MLWYLSSCTKPNKRKKLNMTERKYFTCREVAEHFGVTIPTVWNWIKSKKLKAIKINSKHYRVSASAIIEFHRRMNEN